MGRLHDYFTLTKPNLISLMIFVVLASMVIARGYQLPLLKAGAMLAISYLALGGSAALNNYIDRDIDALMERTAHRPLPSGRIPPRNALAFGLVLVGVSLALAVLILNVVTFAIILVGAVSYVWFYTLKLKRNTPSAVYWGGIPGAIPALGGWSAVLLRDWFTPLLLFSIVFLWQPAHFWSLACYRKEDYQKAGVPVLPVLKDPRSVSKYMVYWNSSLVIPTYLIYFFAGLSPVYLIGVTVLNAALIGYSVYAYTQETRDAYKSSFLLSVSYLFLLFAIMIFSRLIWFD